MLYGSFEARHRQAHGVCVLMLVVVLVPAARTAKAISYRPRAGEGTNQA